jgi:hypothetical protein
MAVEHGAGVQAIASTNSPSSASLRKSRRGTSAAACEQREYGRPRGRGRLRGRRRMRRRIARRLKALHSDARECPGGWPPGSMPTSTRRSPPSCCPSEPAHARSSACAATARTTCRASPPAEIRLSEGYRQRMSIETLLRDLGPILVHGECDDGIGQGQSTDAAALPAPRRLPTLPASVLSDDGRDMRFCGNSTLCRPAIPAEARTCATAHPWR